MKDKVLKAIQDAFSTNDIDDHLEERGDRVYGTVDVNGSEPFDE